METPAATFPSMTSESYYNAPSFVSEEFHVTEELDSPAGEELVRKPQRYVNSVWIIVDI